MNICSCVVHTQPGGGPRVAALLTELTGLEVHGGVDEGKLVVTLEDTEGALAADTMSRLNDVPGVVNTILIYHRANAD
jgi:nitrate reductase NapD